MSILVILELFIMDFVRFESYIVELVVEDCESISEFVKFVFIDIELWVTELFMIVLVNDEFCINDIITKVFCKLE